MATGDQSQGTASRSVVALAALLHVLNMQSSASQRSLTVTGAGEPELEPHPLSGAPRLLAAAPNQGADVRTAVNELVHVSGLEEEDEQEVFSEDRASFAEEQLQRLTARLQQQNATEKELAKFKAELAQERFAKQKLLAQLATLQGEIPHSVKDTDAFAAPIKPCIRQEVPGWVSGKANDAAGHLKRITAVCAASGMSPLQKLMICEVAAQAALDILEGLAEEETDVHSVCAVQPVALAGTFVQPPAVDGLASSDETLLQKFSNALGFTSPVDRHPDGTARCDAEAGRLSGDRGAGTARVPSIPRNFARRIVEASPVRSVPLVADRVHVSHSSACRPGDFAAGATAMPSSVQSIGGVPKRVLSCGRPTPPAVSLNAAEGTRFSVASNRLDSSASERQVSANPQWRAGHEPALITTSSRRVSSKSVERSLQRQSKLISS